MWRVKIDDYSATDLYKIFIQKVQDSGWSYDTTINIKWFEKNHKHFKFYGRDMETLFAKTKISHSRRVFCLDESLKRKLTLLDIDKGLELYLKNRSVNSTETYDHTTSSMYS